MTGSPGGEPNLWRHSRRERLRTAPLATDAAADLLVIGAGFTGCAAALEAAGRGGQAAARQPQRPERRDLRQAQRLQRQ
ncbi:FAD-binding protein [Mangrovicoccus ximenensis]|uniref:FAD-binding protein n=1 Tax=Mangrovicoccus ximenensis TaxID=1911570 RepID=UPI000D3AAA54|nr:FAD-binding protein [Mangrovicoccus ximenensis]